MRLLLIVIISSNTLCGQTSEQLLMELSQSQLSFLDSKIVLSDSNSTYEKELKLIKKYIKKSFNKELVSAGKYRALLDSVISSRYSSMKIEYIIEFTNIESYMSIIYNFDTSCVQRTYKLGNQLNAKPELIHVSEVNIEELSHYFLDSNLVNYSCDGFKAVWLSYYSITKISNIQNWKSVVVPTKCVVKELKNYYRLNFLER